MPRTTRRARRWIPPESGFLNLAEVTAHALWVKDIADRGDTHWPNGEPIEQGEMQEYLERLQRDIQDWIRKVGA